MNCEKKDVLVKLSAKALEQLNWMTEEIFQDASKAGLVLERAIDDLHDKIVKEI